MNRRAFLRTAAATAGSGVLCSGQGGQRKPNLVFILADDLGIPGLSCYGADRFRTPHLDELARGGTRFTNAYTAPLCGPSRALIMTGRYAFRTGATNQDATGRMTPQKEMMIPSVLKPAGYVSAMVGKWGQLPLGPTEFGFDEHFQFTGSGTYWNTQEKGKKCIVNGASKPVRDGEYIPDLMHQFAVDFMTRHRAKPFFLYYSMSHVHGEILPTPDSAAGSKDLYADNIRYMDKLVGKLVAELGRLGLRENTLVVFMGDNGSGGGYADESTIGGKRLAGEKGSMLEGGALVPLIASWPGRTPAKVSSDLIDATDLLPTFAELAGVKPPAERVIDGVSFAPQLRGEKGRPREWMFMQLASMWYVRDQRWKLNQAGELFDMKGAPFAEPKVVRKDAQTEAVRARLQAVLDKLNPAGGIRDNGDGTGRHAGRSSRKKGKE